jgi:hypothetical protein
MKDGLHCVMDKCTFMEKGMCNPGCSFTMTAYDPLAEMLKHLTTVDDKKVD